MTAFVKDKFTPLSPRKRIYRKPATRLSCSDKNNINYIKHLHPGN